MNHISSKGKEIRIPGTEHPITISPTEGAVRVTVAGRNLFGQIGPGHLAHPRRITKKSITALPGCSRCRPGWTVGR
jgi:hypothetical protein